MTQDQEPRLPSRLSPSKIADYAACPRKFYFKSVLRLPSPTTVAAAVGTLSHLVFERVFDLPRSERTLENALTMLEPAWRDLTDESSGDPRMRARAREHAELARAGSPERTELMERAREAVTGWFQMERSWNFDPVGREVEVEAEFDGLRMAGIIDRVDVYTGRLADEVDAGRTEPRDVVVVTDYKAGKLPNPDFDPGARKVFKQLEIYAALLSANGTEVDVLRLVYVRSGSREDGIFTLRVTPAMKANAVARAQSVWSGIKESFEADQWTPKVSALCGYCPFTDRCPEGATEVARREALKAARAGSA